MNENKERIMTAIHNSEFNHKKCGEILIKINDLLFENKCNPIERQYIISLMQSFENYLINK